MLRTERIKRNGWDPFRPGVNCCSSDKVHTAIRPQFATKTPQGRVPIITEDSHRVNMQFIKPIQSGRFPQMGCYFWGGLKRVNGDVLLNGQSSQTEDSSIGSYVEHNLRAPSSVLPTIEDVFFQKVSTKKVELPLQHLAQVAGHLKASVL
jgi:hypothetical protein